MAIWRPLIGIKNGVLANMTYAIKKEAEHRFNEQLLRQGFLFWDAVSASGTRFPLPGRHFNIGSSNLVSVTQHQKYV